MKKTQFFGVKFKKTHLKKLKKYAELLTKWNEKINLVSHNDLEKLFEYHFLDSVTPSNYISTSATIADWGSGAGFPGIPLKIVREDIKLWLLESKRKKASFLMRIVDELELKDTYIWPKRAEEIPQKFDVIISRQAGKIKKLLPLMIPKLKAGGKIIFFKGDGYEKEVNNSKKLLERFNLITEIKTFWLPSKKKRVLLFLKTSEPK